MVSRPMQGSARLDARSMVLKNFWYCAQLSSSVRPRRLTPTRILGRDVVLFRDGASEQVFCMEDSCPHRRAPLSRGRIDCAAPTPRVVCPYHGWSFDPSGRVRDIPSLPEGSPLPTHRVARTYDVQERGGFVWIFFGPERIPRPDRPPIPHIAELDAGRDSWARVYGEVEIGAPHSDVFDNAIDMSHIHYLHAFGDGDSPRIEDLVMDERGSAYACSGSLAISHKPVNVLWSWAKTDSVRVSFTAFLPSTSAIKIRLGGGAEMITFVNTVPIDETRSVNRYCLLRNFARSPLFDRMAERAMAEVFAEDRAMLEALLPPGGGEDGRELSVVTDKPQTAFRTMRLAWEDMGYLVRMSTRGKTPSSSSSS